MRYKPDWEATQKRFEAFWEREVLDRCMIAVSTWKDGAAIPDYTPPRNEEEEFRRWTDPELIIRGMRREFENTYFGGDAFPILIPNLGAAGHAGFFRGAKFRFQGSVWFFKSADDPAELEFDRNSFLYQKTLELARAFAEDSRGDYMVSMPDTTGNADALSHLLGPERLFECFLEEPEATKAALGKIETAYEQIMRDVYDIVREANQGGSIVGWLSTWAPGFHAQMQSDLSVMISRPMFDEFVLPELTRQCDFLDYALYHLDGMEQIRHLDSLLSISRLRAIQWTQVAGQPPATDFIPVLKRIQQAGKCLVMHVSPDQVEPLMQALSSRGLYLLTCMETEAEGRELIKKVEKWTHD